MEIVEDAVVDGDDADPWHIVKPSANPYRNVGILMLFLYGDAKKSFSPTNRRDDDVEVALYCFSCPIVLLSSVSCVCCCQIHQFFKLI